MGTPASSLSKKAAPRRAEREADGRAAGGAVDSVAPPSASSDRVKVVRSSWPPTAEAQLHDTIPAPPWHDDGEDAFEEITKTDLLSERDR